jgi:hypothetical protein
MATNGSKWQLFGNILAADWPLRGTVVAAKGSELAANGNKWQQGLGDALERRWRTRAAGADFVQMMH